MNVSEAIRTKRAVREFKQEALKETEVRAILNAGRRAQSSKKHSRRFRRWECLQATWPALLWV
jgi:nitroreductase